MNEAIEHIIKGCKAGKHDACEQLYKLFASKMWVLCLRYARDYDSAKDILQDGFIKVFEKISQFEGRGHFEGWMRRVFVNIALEEYRKKRFLSIDSVAIPETEEESSDQIECALGNEELLEMVKDLPSQYRMVFNMYAIEGYSHKEIGELLNISEGTSKSNLSRARGILQKKLAQAGVNRIKIG